VGQSDHRAAKRERRGPGPGVVRQRAAGSRRPETRQKRQVWRLVADVSGKDAEVVFPAAAGLACRGDIVGRSVDVTELSRAPTFNRRAARGEPGRRAHDAVRIVYGCMGVLLAAYLVSWLFRTHASSPLDDWCVDGFEVVAAGLCIAKGVPRRPGRAMPLILGLALLSWATGDMRSIRSLTSRS
jgi:hypothetical protein